MRKVLDFLYFWDVKSLTPVKKPALYSLLTLSLGLGISACGETKTAGGGPSGSEAGNAITAEIMTASKSPAALARVRLMDSEDIDGEKVYSAEADKKGKVVIEGVPDGDYTLEATLDGEALQLPVNVSGKDVDLGSDKLKKMATVSGSVGDDAKGTVKVRGMEHSAKVVDGSFTLDSLPEGALSLVFIPEGEARDTSSTYLKVVAGEMSKSSTFADESRSLLLDDFQDSNYQNRFMPAHTYDGGWWYFCYSKENVTPKYVVGEEDIFSLENEGDGNIVAHVAAEFGERFEDSAGVDHWPWALIGIELGKSNKALCNDISSVDSVAFKIKGKGVVRFVVIDANHPTPDEQKIAQYEHTLSENWERVSVPLAEILDKRYSYKCVNQLDWDFIANTDDRIVEVWLDDIELIGGDRLSIWEK